MHISGAVRSGFWHLFRLAPCHPEFPPCCHSICHFLCFSCITLICNPFSFSGVPLVCHLPCTFSLSVPASLLCRTVEVSRGRCGHFWYPQPLAEPCPFCFELAALSLCCLELSMYRHCFFKLRPHLSRDAVHLSLYAQDLLHICHTIHIWQLLQPGQCHLQACHQLHSLPRHAVTALLTSLIDCDYHRALLSFPSYRGQVRSSLCHVHYVSIRSHHDVFRTCWGCQVRSIVSRPPLSSQTCSVNEASIQPPESKYQTGLPLKFDAKGPHQKGLDCELTDVPPNIWILPFVLVCPSHPALSSDWYQTIRIPSPAVFRGVQPIHQGLTHCSCHGRWFRPANE